jgi:hypothetical protein
MKEEDKKYIKKQFEIEDLEDAISTAEHIDDEFWQSSALKAIAEKQAKSGDINGALATAKQIDDEYSLRYTLAAIEKVMKLKEFGEDIYKGETDIYEEDISDMPFDENDSIEL